MVIAQITRSRVRILQEEEFSSLLYSESASVAQLDAPSDWRPGGRGFNPRQGRQHSFVEIDHEIFSTVILSLPLIQEGQLSVSGERMCTILVNRLEDLACPVNVWLRKLTALDMTPLGWLGRKTSTQKYCTALYCTEPLIFILPSSQYDLTHCRLNRLPHTIYWKSPISNSGMSGFEI